MSNSESFIDEVTDEVRRDRLFRLMRRYAWVAAVLVAVVVAGAIWTEYRRGQLGAEAQAFGDAVIAASESADPASAMAAIPATGGRAAVRDHLAAAEALAAGDEAAALALLRELAADRAQPAALRSLARLKAVMLAGPAMGAAERDAVLAELAAPGAPFRLLALEQQAVALIEAGKREEAVTLLRQILAEAGLTAGLQRRASELLMTLDAVPLGAPPAGE